VPGTSYTYGITNRFYAKRKLVPGQPGQSREILDVELTQSYYDNPLASQFDVQYNTALNLNNSQAPSKFSPVALSVRGMPTNDITGTVRAEFDARYHAMRTISANGTYAWTGRLQTSVGWTKSAYIPQLSSCDPTVSGAACDTSSQMITTAANAHTKNNHFGVIYNFNFDVRNSYFQQQQVSGFYNAQCCGLAFQYQQYNFPSSPLFPVPSDHRFFLTFTLAGLGNFSPFNGALGNVPR
ncbi:MAG TPA: LPS assembly protein LptD, partial [Vicinamibacterales bacterium]|nr:LPS assembly protein LptD [Vicinamibacterales bacterium]